MNESDILGLLVEAEEKRRPYNQPQLTRHLQAERVGSIILISEPANARSQMRSSKREY